nr:hypothetical protein [Rickettsia endosymbiont of Ceutorhynchus assimilis]
MTGLQVASGSKNLVLCPDCEKISRQEEINIQISEAITDKNDEIRDLKQKIAEMQRNSMEEKFLEVFRRLESMEKSLIGKISTCKQQQKVSEIPNPNKKQAEQRMTRSQTSVNCKADVGTTLQQTAADGCSSSNSQNLLWQLAPLKQQNKEENGKIPKNDAVVAVDVDVTTDTTKTKTTVPDADVNIVNELENENLEKGKDNLWQTVNSKRKRRNRSMIQPSSRPVPNKGTKEAPQNLKMAENYSWLFVSGFDPDTTAVEILGYIKHMGHNQRCICEKMKTVKGNQRSSFKLGVPNSIANIINNGSSWPRGAFINHFINLQSRPQQPRVGLH